MARKSPKAAHAQTRKPKKVSGRDACGRFAKGTSGNPGGSKRITPEMKAVRDLAAVERVSNVAELVRIRDSSPDVWARIESIKLLLQYSDGKPVTSHTGAPLVNLNLMSGANAMSPEAAYAAMMAGLIPADPAHPALQRDPVTIEQKKHS